MSTMGETTLAEPTVVRSSAWKPFIVLVWLLVALDVLPFLGLLHRSWDQVHPTLVPWSGTGPIIDPQQDDVLLFLVLATFMGLLACVPLAVATFATGMAATAARRGRRRTPVLLLALLLVGIAVVPWWFATDHSSDDEHVFDPGAAYLLAGASVLLSLLLALVLVAYLGIRPLAVRPPQPPPAVPAGWYPDPYGAAPWRWWDGDAWAQGAPPGG